MLLTRALLRAAIPMADLWHNNVKYPVEVTQSQSKKGCEEKSHDDDSHALVCAVRERFALPIYQDFLKILARYSDLQPRCH